MFGLGGSDVIFGNEGSDTIHGEGNDFVYAGSGDDLVTGDGQDFSTSQLLNFGTGDDTLLGEEGDDSLFGNDGNDSIVGGLGNDLTIGESAKTPWRLEQRRTNILR